MNSIRLQDIKSIYKNRLHFYTLIMKQKKKTVPYTTVSKRIKYQEITLTKEVKDL